MQVDVIAIFDRLNWHILQTGPEALYFQPNSSELGDISNLL